MDRREFIKKSLKMGVAAGAALSLGSLDNLIASPSEKGSSPDLVAVKGGDPVSMFRAGIKELGGMKAFVKKGQTVVVKPNIGWDVVPENAANTNPDLITEIIKQCYAAGAKSVSVFDHTCDNWRSCYESSGIEAAVKKAGGKMAKGSDIKYYKKVTIPKSENLKSAMVHELIVDSDVFINVPILKSHGSTKLTIGMKNYMGVVWNRRAWHMSGLNEKISEIVMFRKPDLTIVDAYRVMMKNGPRGVSGDDVEQLEYQVMSRDVVAADSAAAKIFGIEPSLIKYIKYADKLGIGRMDTSILNIKKIKL